MSYGPIFFCPAQKNAVECLIDFRAKIINDFKVARCRCYTASIEYLVEILSLTSNPTSPTLNERSDRDNSNVVSPEHRLANSIKPISEIYGTGIA